MTCPECKDAGYVTLLFSREPCSTCGPGAKEEVAHIEGRTPESNQAHEDMVLTQVQGEPDRPERDMSITEADALGFAVFQQKMTDASHGYAMVYLGRRYSAPTVRELVKMPREWMLRDAERNAKQGPLRDTVTGWHVDADGDIWRECADGWFRTGEVGLSYTGTNVQPAFLTPIPRWKDVTDWDDPPAWVMAPVGTNTEDLLACPFVFNDLDWHKTEASAMETHLYSRERCPASVWETSLYRRHPTHPNILQRVWKRGD